MARKKTDTDRNLLSLFTRIFTSKRFFYFILILTAFQGLWYALSFQPIIYDEGRHFGFISRYTDKISPFISVQDPDWDVVGEVTRDGSYLFYYLMSFPLRVAEIFSDSLFVQILSLRLINIAFVIAGLYVYRRVLLRVGASVSVASIILLFFVLTPSLAPLPGAINYDNLVLLLFGLLLLLSIDVMQAKNIDFKKLIYVVSLGLFGTLIKFTFVALFAPVFLFVTYRLLRRHGKKIFVQLRKSFFVVGLAQRTLLIILLVAGLGLFIERPVQNFVKYGQVAPQCTKIISEERCKKNFTANRNLEAAKNKPRDFKPATPYSYTVNFWITGMITTQTRILPWRQPLPIMPFLYFTAVFGGAVLVLLYLREIVRKSEMWLLLVVSVTFTVILCVYNYTAYIELAQPVAITGRYLAPVVPIYMLFLVFALNAAFRKHKQLLVIALILLLGLFTQGGGIISHLFQADDMLYWSHSQEPNADARDKLDDFIVESRGAKYVPY